MPRRRDRAFAAGVALVLLATLAACGDDPSDEGEPAGGGTTAAASAEGESEGAATTAAAATTEAAPTSTGASTSAGAASTTTVPPAATGEVEIADFAFVPEEIEITAGGEVIWFNNDDFAHRIVASDSENPFPGEGTIDTGETYAVTFADVGIYEYFCGIHNSMTGSVVVT